MLVFEDETTITQKPCIRKSMSFEGEQQKIEHNGSREKFSAYISTLWPEEKLMYNFYDEMNSINSKRAVQYTQRNPHDTYVISTSKKTALILIAVKVIFVLPASASGYIAESATYLSANN